MTQIQMAAVLFGLVVFGVGWAALRSLLLTTIGLLIITAALAHTSITSFNLLTCIDIQGYLSDIDHTG